MLSNLFILQCIPLIEVYQKLKDEDDLRVIWPAVALRFLKHPLVEEAFCEGSLFSFIDAVLQGHSKDDRTVAMLLLCPEQRSLRLAVNDCVLPTEPARNISASCINCAVTKAELIGSEAARDAISRGLISTQIRLRAQEQALSELRANKSSTDTGLRQRIAEAVMLQTRVDASEKLIAGMCFVSKNIKV